MVKQIKKQQLCRKIKVDRAEYYIYEGKNKEMYDKYSDNLKDNNILNKIIWEDIDLDVKNKIIDLIRNID